jgi:hypothetical protein
MRCNFKFSHPNLLWYSALYLRKRAFERELTGESEYYFISARDHGSIGAGLPCTWKTGVFQVL